LPDNRR